MAHKIIMTVGYPEMANTIRRISRELGFDVVIVEGILQEAAKEVKRNVDTGDYEVVVSRSGTAKEISKIVDLPIVYSDSDHFDLVKGFKKAKELGEKICFITYPEEGFMFNFKEIIDIIGFEVMILPYKTQEELISQIKFAKESGIEVVVGGGIRAAEFAQSYGMKSMYLSISERSIKRTLILADKVARDRIRIKKEAESLDAVINASEEGILFLNEEGKIEACNQAIERIFNVKIKDLRNKSPEDLKNDELGKLLKNQKIYMEKGNFTLGNINISYEPVILNKERIGIVITVREVSQVQKLETKIRRDLHKKGLLARFTFSDITHQSEQMKSVIQLANEYAVTDSTILIIGESGTGKELLTQSIHNASNRKERPFVAVNCAALPENLLESELFGYTEGAFTGANKGGRQGVFELAHEGTIFLDEIGEIPSHIQTRLLRVLQEKEVMRIGADHVTPVDIRIVAATNQKLWNLVQEGKFRLDLYFRLSVLHLNIPPLFQRKDDIPTLVNHFLSKVNADQTFEDFSTQLQHFFMTYRWPGNVRQLENVVERYYLRVHHTNMEEQAFMNEILNETEVEESQIGGHDSMIVETGTIGEIEKQVILQMLDRHNDNKTIVAEKLGISRTTLWKRLNED
ncbi:sigma 54-interacting transcriptional regulator [Oceanobacillus jeddahense]|uniref:sigma 54-interacting transcriptional regulator n=1 Tax=Oceanobacillus jeddahense TaxID=1462527 RepID=UPI000693E965|nr:sigma 54-interacting transcriptional regulator [Oceanobacillus jeddahense]